MPLSSDAHYDRVTNMWKELMGEHFHFGYFENENMDLADATVMMVEKMLEFCRLDAQSRVLDVGCGIGAPAFYLHEKYGCAVDGISTSERGIELASKAAREKGYDKVRFKVADGMDNGYPDETFDIVWIMEAAHAIPDKGRLFRECHRVLKSGGLLVLCDLVQKKALSFLEGLVYLATHFKESRLVPRVFGPAQILSAGGYCDLLLGCGFSQVTAADVTPQAFPTLRRWRENALCLLEKEPGGPNTRQLEDFARACLVLEEPFREGHMGYGMIKAVKR